MYWNREKVSTLSDVDCVPLNEKGAWRGRRGAQQPAGEDKFCSVIHWNLLPGRGPNVFFIYRASPISSILLNRHHKQFWLHSSLSRRGFPRTRSLFRPCLLVPYPAHPCPNCTPTPKCCFFPIEKPRPFTDIHYVCSLCSLSLSLSLCVCVVCVCVCVCVCVWRNVYGSPLNSLINRFGVCLWQPLTEKLRQPFRLYRPSMDASRVYSLYVLRYIYMQQSICLTQYRPS
jgi:hypothetical protein